MPAQVGISLEWDGPDPQDFAEALAEFGRILPDHLERAGEDIGARVQSTAARIVNVDTGRLRASIDSEVDRMNRHVIRVVVGSNVEYAPFHEMDYPYLRPAFEAEAAWIESRYEKAIESAWQEAMR